MKFWSLHHSIWVDQPGCMNVEVREARVASCTPGHKREETALAASSGSST